MTTNNPNTKKSESAEEKTEVVGASPVKNISEENPSQTVPPESIRDESKEKAETQHRYLQNLIKRISEEKGYKATIEQPTPDGLGRVDVSLEKNGKKIACEISITTTSEHELENIDKCLKAGYDKVIMCSPEKKNLEKIRILAMEKLADSGLEKVMFFEPEELLFYLEDEAAQELNKEARVKGYKVKVNYQPVNLIEKKTKRDMVTQILVGAMRRMKDK